MRRIAIAGGPRTGKTTLARRLALDLGVAALHTDDLIHLGWSEASEAAAEWFDLAGPIVVEGVAVPRALRKWLRSHPVGAPVEILHYLDEPIVPVSTGQDTMRKGVDTVMREVIPELMRRGVLVK